MSEVITTNTTEPQVEAAPEIDKAAIIAASPFNVPFVIERNGIKVQAEVFVGAQRAKSKWSGIPWVAPQISTTEGQKPDEKGQGGDKGYQHDSAFHTGIQFVGRSNVVNALNIILRRYGQDFLTDSTSELDGTLNLDAYHKAWTELATSALKISELEELIQTEQEKQAKNLETLVSLSDQLANAASGLADGTVSTEQFKHVKHQLETVKFQIETVKSQINAYRQQLTNRKGKRSKEQQAETVAPV